MKNISYMQTDITGGFWKKRQDMVRRTTIHTVYDRFKETGRFSAFHCDPEIGPKAHIFWDSDVAKWMESVAYLTAKKSEPKLEKIVDGVVDLMEKNITPEGYYNSYFIPYEPAERRFTERDWHELYCIGHFIEAAVAYFEATGKRKLLDLVCRMADYVYLRFVTEKSAAFTTPGHEEIELALVKLYRLTGEERYLELSKFFIDERGKHANDSDPDDQWKNDAQTQTHKPVREQMVAEGHAVRALYLLCGMADVAEETGDSELLDACRAQFENIVTRRMYITGGVGSSHDGEAFTVDYDLPNMVNYSESCAAIALAFFCNRMLRHEADSRYADTIERVLYNGFLSSVSLDGRSFFYVNPMEIQPRFQRRNVTMVQPHAVHLGIMERVEVFDCSCCPPNITRFLSSLGDYICSDDGETVYVHQFMQSKTAIERDGKTLMLEQITRYPDNGKVTLRLSGGDTRVAVRIPSWCDSYTGETVKGYAYFDMKDGEEISFDFVMKPRLVAANPKALFCCGRVAVMRGPVVYCLEAKDNGEDLRDIRIDRRARFRTGRNTEIGVPTLTVRAYRRAPSEELYAPLDNNFRQTEATFIPYYAFANRGESEMLVYCLYK